MQNKIVTKKPGEAPVTITNTAMNLDNLDEIVGGYIETVHIPDSKLILICNEEGKLHKLQPNLKLPYDVVVGRVAIVTLTEDSNDFDWLTDEQVEEAIKFLFTHGI